MHRDANVHFDKYDVYQSVALSCHVFTPLGRRFFANISSLVKQEMQGSGQVSDLPHHVQEDARQGEPAGHRGKGREKEGALDDCYFLAT
jgi:hypothetical protein